MTHMTPTFWLDSIVDEVEFDAILWDDSLLGCSPAELSYNVESERDPSWADHDGCPELRLYTDWDEVA